MRRAVLAIAVLLATSLAGCSGGGTSSLVLTPGDLGAGFFYIPMDDENQQDFFAFLNMTTNPGFGDTDIVQEDGGTNVTSLYVSIIGYNGSTEEAVLSAAVVFRSGSDLEAWLAEEFEECEEDIAFAAFRKGNTLSLHDGEDVDEGWDLVRAGIDRFQDRTGATPVCAPYET